MYSYVIKMIYTQYNKSSWKVRYYQIVTLNVTTSLGLDLILNCACPHCVMQKVLHRASTDGLGFPDAANTTTSSCISRNKCKQLTLDISSHVRLTSGDKPTARGVMITTNGGVPLHCTFDCITDYLTMLYQLVDYLESNGIRGCLCTQNWKAWRKKRTWHISIWICMEELGKTKTNFRQDICCPADIKKVLCEYQPEVSALN
jgi:hypothetical protein